MINPVKIKNINLPAYKSVSDAFKPSGVEKNNTISSINNDVSNMNFNDDVILEGAYVDESGKSFDATYYYSQSGIYNVKYKDGIKDINLQFQVDGTKLSSIVSYISENGSVITEKITYLNGSSEKKIFENDILKSIEIINTDGTISTTVYDGDKVTSEKILKPDGTILEKTYEYSKTGVIERNYSNGLLEGINITEDGHTFSNSEYNFGQIIVDFATSQVGQDGEKYWDYLKGSGFINGSSTPWCACFISWITGNVSYNGQKISDIIGHEGPGVYGFVTDAYDKGILRYNDACPNYQGLNDKPYTPKPGDLVVFDWDENWTKNPYEERDIYMNDHIGIVKEVNGNGLITVEGNADNSVKVKETYDITKPNITLFIDWQSNI